MTLQSCSPRVDGRLLGICDILRGMLVVDDMRKAGELVARLSRAPELKIVRMKERYLAKPAGGGWRDALLNARFADGTHVFEVQVVHRELLVARHGLPGHAVYDVVRVAAEILERLGVGPVKGRKARIALLPDANAAKLLRAGVSVADLVGTFDASTLKTAGVPASALSAAGVTLAELLAARYGAEDLRAADAEDPGALLAAGYDWDEVATAFDVTHDPDRLALLHLHRSLGSSDFLRKKLWGSAEPLARWWGVDADAKGRVVGLSLANIKHLRGALPDTLGRLRKLERLSVAGNCDIGGEIPLALAAV